MTRRKISPDDPVDQQPIIGLIGMGAMGRMYVKHLSAAGWKKIYVCDKFTKYLSLKEEYNSVPGVKVLPDGFAVSRSADFLMYSVEAEFIDRVVAQYGPSTKMGAIVAGQTSVKTPEKQAFETYLPPDVSIVSCHSMHGPSVSPLGQPLVLIKHRASDEDLSLVEDILRCFRSRYVYLSYEEHDLVTANTQAVTHAAFLSMGTAWSHALSYPWEHGYYVGGIETVKVNIMLRIYSNKWHVYAGLAILNPSARMQIEQYAKSASEIFKLMLNVDENGLRSRMYNAYETVFGGIGKHAPGLHEEVRERKPILLSEDVLDQFSLSKSVPPIASNTPTSDTPENAIPMNSHLSLLAMVDCWAHLGINPFLHLDLAATPIFRLWIGVAEYLFRSRQRLDSAIHAALYDVSHREDDLEFVIAARGWNECVQFGNFDLYEQRFTATAAFFQSRFEDAHKVGSAMIEAIINSSGVDPVS